MVEKLTGMPFQDALSREIWTQIGAEGDAAMLAPRFGVPLFAGGFLARPRDLARFGLLFTPSYSIVSDERSFPIGHIKMLKNGGRPELLANAALEVPRTRRWIKRSSTMSTSGTWSLTTTMSSRAAGPDRVLLVNPDRDLVAVYVGYFNDDQSELEVLPRLREVLNGIFAEVDGPK